jgi:hypothetical protein
LVKGIVEYFRQARLKGQSMNKPPLNFSELPNLFSKKLTPQFVFAFLCCLIIGLNLFSFSQEVMETLRVRKTYPYFFHGLQFSGLNHILKGQRRIGYYTDRNIDDLPNALKFSQAQYILAPIMLDLNNTDCEFIIFDCSSPLVAINKIKALKVVPLQINPFGIILARHPVGQNRSVGDK